MARRAVRLKGARLAGWAAAELPSTPIIEQQQLSWATSAIGWGHQVKRNCYSCVASSSKMVSYVNTLLIIASISSGKNWIRLRPRKLLPGNQIETWNLTKSSFDNRLFWAASGQFPFFVAPNFWLDFGNKKEVIFWFWSTNELWYGKKCSDCCFSEMFNFYMREKNINQSHY